MGLDVSEASTRERFDAAAERPLDFFLFGVPRSGTSGLARAVNTHPRAFCGMEFFVAGQNLDDLTAPSCFLDPKPPADTPRNIAKRGYIEHKLKRGGIAKYGNKHPRHFLELPALREHNPDARFIAIYRDTQSVMRSWDRRARDPGDPWPDSLHAIVALIDTCLLVSSLAAERGDVLVISYEDFFFENPGIFGKMLDFLGLDGDSAHARQKFDEKIFARPEIPRQKAVLSDDPIARAVERAGFPEIDALLLQTPIHSSLTIRSALAETLTRHEEAIHTAIFDQVARMTAEQQINLALWLEKTMALIDPLNARTKIFTVRLAKELARFVRRNCPGPATRAYSPIFSARMDVLAGNHDKAVSTLERLVESSPKKPSGYLESALLHLRAGNLAAARNSTESALALIHNQTRPMVEVALDLIKAGRKDAGLWLLAEIVNYLEKSPDRELPLGRCYTDRRTFEPAAAEALTALDRADDGRPVVAWRLRFAAQLKQIPSVSRAEEPMVGVGGPA